MTEEPLVHSYPYSPSSLPSVRSLVLVPALITLGVTLLRLVAEVVGAPGWLASDEAGGHRALLGIVWLPLVFGPWYALRIRPHVAGTKALVKRLSKTLLVYGLLARAPVWLLTIPAVLGGWGTHYDKLGFEAGAAAKIAAAFGAQMIFWACVWTVVTGTVAGLIAVAVRAATQPAAAADGRA
jgi:hypothetical protein